MLPRPVNQEVRPAVALHPLPPPSCAGGTGVKVGRATLTVVAVGFIGVTVGAAVGAANGPIHPDLARVIELWPTLSTDCRAAILAMLRAAE